MDEVGEPLMPEQPLIKRRKGERRQYARRSGEDRRVSERRGLHVVQMVGQRSGIERRSGYERRGPERRELPDRRTVAPRATPATYSASEAARIRRMALEGDRPILCPRCNGALIFGPPVPPEGEDALRELHCSACHRSVMVRVVPQSRTDN